MMRSFFFVMLLLATDITLSQQLPTANFISISYQGLSAGGAIHGVYYVPVTTATSLNKDHIDRFDKLVMGLNVNETDYDKVMDFLRAIDTTYIPANLSDHFLIILSVNSNSRRFRLPVTRLQRNLTPLLDYFSKRKEEELLLSSLQALMKIR
jgi:hypothetical protein